MLGKHEQQETNMEDQIQRLQKETRKIERRMNACFCGGVYHYVDSQYGDDTWLECTRGRRIINAN